MLVVGCGMYEIYLLLKHKYISILKKTELNLIETFKIKTSDLIHHKSYIY